MHICQSPEWANFKESYGNKAVKAGGVYFFKTKVPFFPFFVGYCPKADLTKVDFSKVEAVAKKEKCIFVKFDPCNFYEDKINLPKNLKIFKAKSIFSQKTIILDITPTLKELKVNLKAKTRYNVGLAERKGVNVREGNEADLKTFLQLQKKTAQRQGFYAHPDSYFKKMWDILYPAGMMKLLIAEIDISQTEGKNSVAGGSAEKVGRQNPMPIAAWVLFTYGGILYYPYGASDYHYREYMPSDLMMWEAIKLGKKLDCTTFDMWGATSNQKDPWWGFTRFKLGFGGKMVEFVESYDLVLNRMLYFLFDTANRLRWLILKLKAKS